MSDKQIKHQYCSLNYFLVCNGILKSDIHTVQYNISTNTAEIFNAKTISHVIFKFNIKMVIHFFKQIVTIKLYNLQLNITITVLVKYFGFFLWVVFLFPSIHLSQLLFSQDLSTAGFKIKMFLISTRIFERSHRL